MTVHLPDPSYRNIGPISQSSAPLGADAAALSPDALILLVANQCKESDALINKYLADHNKTLQAKKDIGDVLSLIDANAGGINDKQDNGWKVDPKKANETIQSMSDALDDAIKNTSDPQLKDQLQNVKTLLLNGAPDAIAADDKVVKDEMDSMKDMLKQVSGGFDASDESFMMTMQQEMDKKKQICDLASQWLSKMNETTQDIINNSK